MIAWCGNCMLYSFFEINNLDNRGFENFTNADIAFSDFTEIVRVLDTSNPDQF